MGRARSNCRFELASAKAALVVLACAACTPVFTTTSFSHSEPRGELEIDHGSEGRWLGMMRGASGAEVAELPGGDVFLSGHGQTVFVSRLSPDGEELWTLPLASCSFARIAAGSDDELFVTARDLRALPPGAIEHSNERKVRCDPGRSSGKSSILRLNGRGKVLWRADAFGGSEPARMLATPGRLFVVGHTNSGAPGTPVSVLHSYTAGGRGQWSREYAGYLSAEALSRDGRTVFAAFSGQSAPCSLRALDAATGDVRWERSLDLEAVGAGYCLPRELTATRRGALLWASGPTDRVAGIDLATGKPFWTKEPEDFDGGMAGSFIEVAPRELGLFVRYRITTRRAAEIDPVLMGVDPKSGDTVSLATFEESIPDVMSDGASMGGHFWGQQALLVTGSFYGTLSVFDMHVSTDPRYDTTCVSIDPGFYVGPRSSPPSKPSVVKAQRREDVVCPGQTYESRRRTYESTLFLARFPVSSFVSTIRDDAR